jgi:hypothetical protein
MAPDGVTMNATQPTEEKGYGCLQLGNQLVRKITFIKEK